MKTAKRYTYFVIVADRIISTCKTIADARRVALDHADAKIARMPRMISRSGQLTVSREQWNAARLAAFVAVANA